MEEPALKFPHNKINTSKMLERMPMEIQRGGRPRWQLGSTLAPVGHIRNYSLAASLGWGNKFPAVYLCQTHLGSSKQNSGEHQQLASIYFQKWSQRGVWASLIMNQTAITMTTDNSRNRKQANHRGPICILICVCMHWCAGGGRKDQKKKIKNNRRGWWWRMGRDTGGGWVCVRKG